MKRVLVTHADEPIGRRIVKRLYHDAEVEMILGVGDGPTPHAFDRFLAEPEPRLHYARADLAKHRPVTDLFHSAAFRSAQIDTVVHLPRHAPPTRAARPLVAGLAERTAETRLVLQHCLESAQIEHLVAVGSAFVYRLPPGNANRLREESALDLEPDVPPEIRSLIDCDMLLHGEIHSERMRVVLLRVPSVVAADGCMYLSPPLEEHLGVAVRRMGFDPLCALVSDKDVARAVQAAVHAQRTGIYNIAGREAIPLSLLARWTGRVSVPLPGPLLAWLSRGARLVGNDACPNARCRRYGFTLDTRRAEAELGFRPRERVELTRAGDGSLRLETNAL